MAREVVPALLAADGAAGNVHLGPGSRLCVWDGAESGASPGKNRVQQGHRGVKQPGPPPPHLAPLIARHEVLPDFCLLFAAFLEGV